MRPEISSILEPQEAVSWQGAISRKVIWINLVLSVFLLLLIAGVIFSLPRTVSAGFALKDAIGSAVLVLGLLLIAIKAASDYVIVYALTNKRVIIRSGIIAIDFASIYFNQIRSANARVRLLDKILAVGSIDIDTGKVETVSSGSGAERRNYTQTAYDRLLYIDHPYDVYKDLQVALSRRQESLYSGRADDSNRPTPAIS